MQLMSPEAINNFILRGMLREMGVEFLVVWVDKSISLPLTRESFPELAAIVGHEKISKLDPKFLEKIPEEKRERIWILQLPTSISRRIPQGGAMSCILMSKEKKEEIVNKIELEIEPETA